MENVVKTNVPGLDRILNVGLAYNPGTIIVLRGERGIHKTPLALQMMLGIHRGICKRLGFQGEKSAFYSLNKTTESMKKMFRGLVISEEIEKIKKGIKDSETNEYSIRQYVDKDGYIPNFEELILQDVITFNPQSNQFIDRRNGANINTKVEHGVDKKYSTINIVGYLNEENPTSYLQSELIDFDTIMQEVAPMDGQGEDKKKACIVVDGLSRIRTEILDRLPLEALIARLRKCACFSILVLDKRFDNTSVNSDVIIDMRRNVDQQHSYTYHELQVTKNVFQQVAYGWHKYKSIGGMIRVYPSIHKVLQQKASVDNTFYHAINDNICYKQTYLSAFRQNANPSFSVETWKFMKDFPAKSETKETLGKNAETHRQKSLADILTPIYSKEKRNKISAFVGANNTFKRYLTAVSILYAASNGEQVFILLLDEEKHGFQELIDKVRRDAGISESIAEKIYGNIFIWEVRMGCISPEELLYFIEDFIKISRRRAVDKPIQLVILDVVAIDHSFPMLRNETLFLPALVTLCKAGCVGLHLVCNKRFSLVETVCSIADSLLCLEREPGDPVNSLRIYVEKNTFGCDYSSRVFQVTINDINQLFDNSRQQTDTIFLRTDLNCVERSTIKEFWRQALNVKNVVTVNDLSQNSSDAS